MHEARGPVPAAGGAAADGAQEVGAGEGVNGVADLVVEVPDGLQHGLRLLGLHLETLAPEGSRILERALGRGGLGGVGARFRNCLEGEGILLGDGCNIASSPRDYMSRRKLVVCVASITARACRSRIVAAEIAWTVAITLARVA